MMERKQIATQILCAMLSNSWMQKEFHKDMKKLGFEEYNKEDFLRKWHTECE